MDGKVEKWKVEKWWKSGEEVEGGELVEKWKNGGKVEK